MKPPMKIFAAPLPFEPKRRTHRGDRASTSKKSSPNVAALLLPTLSPEASRRKTEAEGFANFGRRTWFLVERSGVYRAVESLDDAPGWRLAQEMKRQ